MNNHHDITGTNSRIISRALLLLLLNFVAWGSVVVKALRY